ncbi:MAG: SDR family oxidoreductase [Dehalococcoidia bacterium]|nr:SDR family oxidoreductase [Dehalococcoidia bacterium]
MYESLRGKRAVVLGGSRGIGRAIAIRLALEGCDVIVNYARGTEAAEQTAADCRSLGVRAEAVRADVGDAAQVHSLFALVEERGGLDILVSNAARGLERPRPAIEQRPRHLHETMEVNLFGPWSAAQAALPLLEARGGSIVNLLTPGSFHYMPDYSAVGITKAALASLTMYLAVELAPRGIRVNGVSAGWVEGSDGEHSYRAEISDKVRPYVPVGRNVHPDDVAAVVAWICSDEAPMLVGQTIHIDGGFAASAWEAVLAPHPADA